LHKSEKEQVIQELNTKFARAKSAVLAEFSKLDVAAVTQLRKKCRDAGVEYRVIKNTLAKRAAKGTPLESLSDDFTGSVALALSYADVIAPAKILTDFAKGLDAIKLRGGMLEGQKLDPAKVKAVAKMPGLRELRAQTRAAGYPLGADDRRSGRSTRQSVAGPTTGTGKAGMR